MSERPVLPDGVVSRLNDIVGDENVLCDDEGVERYSHDTSAWRRVCSAVVFPSTTAEVAQIVQLACEFNLPVWPFSKGKNWGYGATMAFHDGALIVMLDRMNRIHHVDEEMAYAVIEPGVTQQQLNEYLKEKQIKLWIDCTDSTPHGSVIGNALEHGVGYTPYWDHFANICGLEAVLPDGSVVRTGGGPENSRTWNLHKWGTGPYLEGLFSQSNFGIVTQAGVWLMPEPERTECFVCEADDANMPRVVGAIRRLLLKRAIPGNVHMSNDIMFIAQVMQYPYDDLGERTYLSDELRRKFRQRFNVNVWSISGALYGTRSQVRTSRSLVKKELGHLTKLIFMDEFKVNVSKSLARRWRDWPQNGMRARVCRTLTGASLEKLELLSALFPVFKGIPGERIVTFAYFKKKKRPNADVDPARDRAGLIFFTVVSPLASKDTERLVSRCKEIYHNHGFDHGVTFIVVNSRSTLALMPIFYNKDDANEAERAKTLYDEVAAVTLQEGFQQYRTSVFYSDRMLAYVPEWRGLLDSMKAAIDPANIIAPGRYGIGLPCDGGESSH